MRYQNTAMLRIDHETALAIDAISQHRSDGGLGITFDGTHYLCQDVRDNEVFAEFWPLLANATPVLPTVTPRQAKIALYRAGLLDVVIAYIATAPREIQIEWEEALEFKPDYAPIMSAAAALGIPSDQVLQLFAVAATI